MFSIRLKGVTFRSFGRGVLGVLAWKEAGRRLMPAGERLGGRGEPEEERMGDKDPTEPRPDPRPVTLLLRNSRSCLCGRERSRSSICSQQRHILRLFPLPLSDTCVETEREEE